MGSDRTNPFSFSTDLAARRRVCRSRVAMVHRQHRRRFLAVCGFFKAKNLLTTDRARGFIVG